MKLTKDLLIQIYSYLSIHDLTIVDTIFKLYEFNQEELIRMVYDPYNPLLPQKCKQFLSARNNTDPEFLNRILNKPHYIEPYYPLEITLCSYNDSTLFEIKNLLIHCNCRYCREIVKDKQLPTIIVTKPSYYKGLYTYSFALNPEEHEPQGGYINTFKCLFGHTYKYCTTYSYRGKDRVIEKKLYYD